MTTKASGVWNKNKSSCWRRGQRWPLLKSAQKFLKRIEMELLTTSFINIYPNKSKSPYMTLSMGSH